MQKLNVRYQINFIFLKFQATKNFLVATKLSKTFGVLLLLFYFIIIIYFYMNLSAHFWDLVKASVQDLFVAVAMQLIAK